MILQDPADFTERQNQQPGDCRARVEKGDQRFVSHEGSAIRGDERLWPRMGSRRRTAGYKRMMTREETQGGPGKWTEGAEARAATYNK